MSALSIPKLLTVEEYEQIRDPPGGRYGTPSWRIGIRELPKRLHKDLQRLLRKQREPICEPPGYTVDTEYPYKPLPEHEVWGADVACVSSARDEGKEGWLEGSPELVIEVKSRSNTKAELHDEAMTTLAGQGAVEFRVVDPLHRTVTVYTKTSGIHVYAAGEDVPLALFGAQRLKIAGIFS